MLEFTKTSIIEILNEENKCLKPSQEKVFIPIIERIYIKMFNDLKFKAIQVHNNELIINGHHRYIASLIAKKGLERKPCPKPDAAIEYDWNEVEFDENDPENNLEIMKHHGKDAAYNEMEIDEIFEIMK